MHTSLTVVMYHYVRPANIIRETGIPGLPLERFRAQLAYLRKHHTVLDPFDFVRNGIPETEKPPALLTFDDAYTDHYTWATPILEEVGLSGIFFVPAEVVEKRRLLDVNKIHYLLGCTPERSRIIDFMHRRINEATTEYDLLPLDEYRRLYHDGAAFKPGTRTFDDRDTTYIKRMLQVGLPQPFRGMLLDELFRHFVADDEEAVADRTYCTPAQLQEMVDRGMMLGGHGYRHIWLEFAPPEERRVEIEQSRKFLDRYGGDVETSCFAYPYGSHDEECFPLLRKAGFHHAFTTIKGRNEGKMHDLAIERLDTNDLPPPRRDTA